MQKPTIFENFPKQLAQIAPYGPYRAAMDKLGDGDTFSVWLDVGLYRYPYATLRLLEVWSPDGTEIDAGARDLIEDLAPPGTPLVIETEKGPISGKEIKTFERFVATVILPDMRILNLVLEAYLERHGIDR